MNVVRIDARIDFQPTRHIGESRRLDPVEKTRRKAVQNKRWQIANRARLAELARLYRARKIAAGVPYNNRGPRRRHRIRRTTMISTNAHFYILTKNQKVLYAPQDDGITLLPIFVDLATAQSHAAKHPDIEVDAIDQEQLDKAVTMASIYGAISMFIGSDGCAIAYA